MREYTIGIICLFALGWLIGEFWNEERTCSIRRQQLNEQLIEHSYRISECYLKFLDSRDQEAMVSCWETQKQKVTSNLCGK